MSLKAELDAFRSEFMTQVPSEIRDAMIRADSRAESFEFNNEIAASSTYTGCRSAQGRGPDRATAVRYKLLQHVSVIGLFGSERKGDGTGIS